MPVKKRSKLSKVKPVARRVRVLKPVRVAKRPAAQTGRKVFSDVSVFGALPGMSEWALPLLKELRNE
jgi:hypothetical protein